MSEKIPLRRRRTIADLYGEEPEVEQQPTSEEDGGFWDTIGSIARTMNPALLASEAMKPDGSPLPWYLGGAVAETAGNAIGSDTMANLRPQRRGGEFFRFGRLWKSRRIS